jgi:hypothetical protein
LPNLSCPEESCHLFHLLRFQLSNHLSLPASLLKFLPLRQRLLWRSSHRLSLVKRQRFLSHSFCQKHLGQFLPLRQRLL